MDYEKYKYLCEHFVDEVSGNKLPIRLTLEEQQEAIKAFGLLAVEQYL